QAGVIFAAAVILYALIFDLGNAQRAIRPWVVNLLVPLGLLLYIGVGIVTILKGGVFLEYGVLEHDPVHGQHLGILLVELGVGTTVAGVMLTIFYGFGEVVRG
ncbi:MAG: MnhB domain-containing protein, partial [Acidobacteriota bacterium]|nr:MnhB domain-containing protein [Acidobacteriota bacterium]